MKTVLIISYSPLHRDPRILRQIQALKNDYRIMTIGDTPSANNDIIHYSNKNSNKIYSNVINKYFTILIKNIYLLIYFYKFIPLILEIKLNIKYILSYNIERPDFIIANDWDGLYLASELNKKNNWNAKIYFDAHEYAPKQMNSIKWRIITRPIIIYALKKCKFDIGVMSTVCEGIAKEYEHFFDFPEGFVKIITNASEYNNVMKPDYIKNGKIRLIHHGGAQKERSLELMINMMKYLDPEKYELTFMLVNSQPKYYKYLLNKAKKRKNINFIEPVPFSEITKTINKFDIGVYILKPKSFNQKYALPNKLFEFLQARIAIAIGPSVEMVKIIDNYNLGVHSKYFTAKSLAKTIAQLSPEKIMEFKHNADKCAKELSAEENIKKIKNIMTELSI